MYMPMVKINPVQNVSICFWYKNYIHYRSWDAKRMLSSLRLFVTICVDILWWNIPDYYVYGINCLKVHGYLHVKRGPALPCMYGSGKVQLLTGQNINHVFRIQLLSTHCCRCDNEYKL